MNSRTARYVFSVLLPVILGLAAGNATAAGAEQDTHYNDIGFFDIHVCNWPERKLFFMPLFSTPRYNDILKIDIVDPDGQPLAELDLNRFRVIKPEKGPEKHAFIGQLDVPQNARDGWYGARVTLLDGSVHSASDYVKIATLGKAGGQRPGPDEELQDPPRELRWDPVAGAGFYQVFIRDEWNDGRLIHTSKLLTEASLVVPPGLFERGGMYSWVIHARDVNEDPVLGDFNHGSMSKAVVFSISD